MKRTNSRYTDSETRGPAPRRSSPEALYRAEKARRRLDVPHDALMAEAKREFQRMLDDSRATRKGGRPKKNAAPRAAAPTEDVELDEGELDIDADLELPEGMAEETAEEE